MTVNSISAASLSHDVLAASEATPLKQALQTVQDSLTSGDLSDAQAAFNTLQKLNNGLAIASGGNLSDNSALSTDLAGLGKALGSGNLASARSSFAAVQSDLKNSTSPSLINEINVASQSAQFVQQLLSTANVNTSSSSSPDSTVSVLERVYGSSGILNVKA